MKKEQAFVAIYLLAPNISNTSNYKIVIFTILIIIKMKNTSKFYE